MTILFFVAIFAGMGTVDVAGDYQSPGLLILGTFTGSALWWFILTSGASLLKTRFDERTLHWVNKASGIVLVVFGVLSLRSLL